MHSRLFVIVCLLALLLTACASPSAAPTTTALPPAPPAVLRLATTTSTADSGLLDAILPVFEKDYQCQVDVVAVGSGQALEIGRQGDADVLLVHSRKGEDQFVAEGHALARFDVMVNDFIIVGPTADPAAIGSLGSAKEAFTAIMTMQAPFASRGDKSGTNTKELSIWASAGITPTADMTWYNALGQGMGDTLLFAQERQAYTLSDRATFLAMKKAMKDKLPGLAILVGGASLADNKDKSLLNPYGVLAVNPQTHPGVNTALADQFVAWILAPATQQLIGAFGVDQFGQPLFYPNVNQ